MDKEQYTEDLIKPPSPLEFDKFLPWACDQLQMEAAVFITRIQQQEYYSANTSERAKSKTKSKAKVLSQATIDSEIDHDYQGFDATSSEILHIQTVYDHSDNLVQVRFDKNKSIPRLILKVIGLTVKYHPHFTSIVINKGINEYTNYELSKFLPLSYISDICLDGTYLKNANYQLLLQQKHFLKSLSLARCGIDDVVVTIIANTLTYPLPASKSLSILNLSSNRITDVGTMALANSLRTNRQLSYLNLSNNMISDEGAKSLLNTLVSFSVSFSELLASRSRHIRFLKEKSDRVAILVKELRASEYDKRPTRQKTQRNLVKKGRLEREVSAKTLHESKSTNNLEALFEKAAAIVSASIGPFNDPFNKANTFVEDGITYCLGNNSLCYLNLSYNNWSFLTLKNILSVLVYQKQICRKPRGLLNLSIEGNCIPINCIELQYIDYLLDDCLSTHHRDLINPKKKTLTKNQK